MLQLNSLKQFLRLLSLTKEGYLITNNLKDSYKNAVHKVSKEYKVRYQTIADFRRRLELKDISEFHVYLEDWLQNGSKKLQKILLSKCSDDCKNEINNFFNNIDINNNEFSKLQSQNSIFKFELSNKDSKLLKTLAAIKNEDIPNYITKVIKENIRNEYKDLLED